MFIEGSEAKFDVNILGEFTNQSYIGTFRVRCILSPLEDIAADRKYRELLGDNYHLSRQDVRDKAFALSQLEARVISHPPFWENHRIGGGHIPDSNVLLEVLDKAIEAQEKYLAERKKEMEEKQEILTKAVENKKIEKEPELEPLTKEETLGE